MKVINFDPYFNEAGLLVQQGLLSGQDSARMTGEYRFGRWLKLQRDTFNTTNRDQARLQSELDILTHVKWVANEEGIVTKQEPCPGVYVRHPKPCEQAVWADPITFTKDQQRPLVIAMGAFKLKKQLKQIASQQLKRGGYYQDGQNLINPIELGEYIRAFYMAGYWFAAVLYPLLVLTDLLALVLINFDTNQRTMNLLQAKYALPTVFSWFNRKYYGMYWIRFSDEPPLNELYNPIIEKEQ